MAKAKKLAPVVESVPAQKTCCRFKSAGQEITGEITMDKGLGYQVLTGDDDTPAEERVSLFVLKRHIIGGTWTEGEPGAPEAPPVPVEPLDPTSLAGQAALLAAQEPKKADLPQAEPGVKMVQLKQLCDGIEPRIARRRLRKALGNVGTGSRWEWPEGSEELAKVKAILASAPAPITPASTEPEPEPDHCIETPLPADPDLTQDLVTPIEEVEETDE